MYTPHCVPHRVYRFAPCVAVRIVYIGSHRAYRFAPCVPIHTVCTRGKVCTGSHRVYPWQSVYRFAPHVPVHTGCIVPCVPHRVYRTVFTLQRVQHRMCRLTPRVPYRVHPFIRYAPLCAERRLVTWTGPIPHHYLRLPLLEQQKEDRGPLVYKRQKKSNKERQAVRKRNSGRP